MAKPPKPVPGERQRQAAKCFETAERLREHGEVNLAIATYREALKADPRHIAAHNNVAALLRQIGAAASAAEHYRAAIQCNPQIGALHFNLAHTLESLGEPRPALKHYQRATQLEPQNAAARHDYGVLLLELGELDAAVTALEQALVLKPDWALAWANLASAYKARGELEPALSAAERATAYDPALYLGWSNRLFMLPYLAGAIAEERIRSAFSGFDAQFGQAPARVAQPHPPRGAGARLKIGYVSADFRDHAVNYFFEPVLREHDRDTVEIYCYDLNPQADATTARLQGYAAHWRALDGAPDLAIAEAIARDGIDIAIDLMGHTARNRLPIYAYRPAPLQAMWMGWPNSTALSSLDVIISDAWIAAGDDHLLQGPERHALLPNTWICYQADDRAPPVTPLPAQRSGRLRLGSFNGVYKLNVATIETWAKILAALPESELVIAGIPRGRASEWVLQTCLSAGIAPERLSVHPPLDLEGYFALIASVDIALDSYPFNGLTTSLHCLWMGVPVLSRYGRTHASRMGFSLLNNLNMPTWAASDDAGLLAQARCIGASLDELQHRRATLRQTLMDSPLMDHLGHTRRLEALLRGLSLDPSSAE